MSNDNSGVNGGSENPVVVKIKKGKRDNETKNLPVIEREIVRQLGVCKEMTARGEAASDFLMGYELGLSVVLGFIKREQEE